MQTSRFRLSACEREALEALIQDPSTPRRILQRIQIVWLVAMGHGARGVANEVGVSEHTVRLWIGRFREAGVDGLRDLPRPGAPRIHGEPVVMTIRETASHAPSVHGLPYRRWTLDALLGFLSEAHGITIGRSRLHELLQEAGVNWRGPALPAGDRLTNGDGEARARTRRERLDRPHGLRLALGKTRQSVHAHPTGHRHEGAHAS